MKSRETDMSDLLPRSRPPRRRVRRATLVALAIAVPVVLASVAVPGALERELTTAGASLDAGYVAAQVARWRLLTVIAGLGLVAAGFVSTYLLGASLIDLPTEIVDTVRGIADGSVGGRVAVPPTGRSRRLAEAFNEIVDRLETTQVRLEKINIELEQRAQQLQHEVAVRRNMETGLLAAIDAAEAADVAKSEFLTNISHELRTPMTVIMSSTELLLDCAQDPDQLRFLEIIKQSSDAMLTLINNLIDFSRTERGALDLSIAPFKLRERLERALEPWADAAHAKGLTFSHHVAPGIPDSLTADVDRFVQALSNVVGNAIKFTPKGGVTVSIDEYGRQDSRVCLHVCVRDTGIGIAAALHDVVFEPFTQADGSSTREQGGTGLGLALTRQLVELMEGRIWLESEPGKGSVFHFLVQMSINGGGEAGTPLDEPQLESTGRA